MALKHLRDHAGQHAAIFERICQAWRLRGAVGQHTPRAIRTAQQVGRVEPHKALVPLIIDPAARAQEFGVAVDKGRWDQAVGQQRLVAIQVSQYLFQQFGTLGQAGFQRGKLGG